jgi:hypothetical protein
MSDFRNRLMKFYKEENAKESDELIEIMMRFFVIQLILDLRTYEIELPDEDVCDFYEMIVNLKLRDHQLEYSWDYYCMMMIQYMKRTGLSVEELKEMGDDEIYRNVRK